MLMTASPAADAERWEDARQALQDADEAMLAEAEQQAPLIVLAQLQAISRPCEWLEESISTGALWSPDEILANAIEQDDDSRSAYAELMTGPAAQRLRHAMAEWFGRKYALAIFHDHAEEHA